MDFYYQKQIWMEVIVSDPQLFQQTEQSDLGFELALWWNNITSKGLKVMNEAVHV